MNKPTAASTGKTIDRAKTTDRHIGNIQESVDTLLEQGTQTVEAIRSRVIEATDEAKSKGTVAYARVTKLIKASPLRSVAIAFGLGYVAMRIRTSKLTPIALIAGVGYLGIRQLRR